MDFILQNKLFQLTSARLKDKKREMERYEKVLRLSRSAIYDRINGKVPVSLDEAHSLLQAFDLSWNALLEDTARVASQYDSGILLTRSVETAPEAYMAALYEDTLLLSKSPTARTWHECGAIPVFMLLHNPLLASFKFYFWFKTFHAHHNGESFPRFSARWADNARIRALLQHSAVTLKAYQSIGGVEIWSRNMFDRILTRIQYIREMDGFEDPSMATRLAEELLALSRHMERMARMGRKTPEAHGAPMEVYENRIFSFHSTLTGSSSEHQFLHIDLGYPDFIRYTSADLVQERILRYGPMLRHTEPVTHSERACNVFFKELNEHVTHQMQTC